MCGIAGRFHPVGLPPDPSWDGRAGVLLAHRGPDGEGRYRDGLCELVHRRLALIDLSPTGAQPMSNEDGDVQVVYNGEIYNHPDLRAEMQKRGHRFRGTSDTEVLVHLYEELGPRLVERLRGMFAFAVYDRRRKALLLARDRYGIKPLYFVIGKDQIVFASEIKAILAARAVPREIDRQACYDFLGFGYVPEPASGFAGVQSLPKGTTWLFDDAGAHVARYATLRAVPDPPLQIRDILETVETTLLRAAKAQSKADVPVAALLSGGIDSSLVVAALCRATDAPPATFNVRFPDRSYDETGVALAVARSYRTSHRTVEVEDQVLAPESVIGLLRHFDQPFADSSLIPTYRVCRAIRDAGIICTVSGDGGDEAFGGYASFWRLHGLRSLMRLPGPLQSLLESAGSAAGALTRDFGRQLSKAVRLARTGASDTAALLAGLYSYLSEDQKRELLLPDARRGLLAADRLYGPYEPAGVSDLEALSLRLTEAIFDQDLPSDMLRKVDMMSMRAGIEVRVPLLDDDVVRLGLSLPHRLKTDGRNGKLVLRALARRWLPREAADHPKQGFSIPLDTMVGPEFHKMLADLLLAQDARIRAFMDLRSVDRWLGWFREARARRSVRAISRGGLYQRVFILLALELWLREHRLSW